MGVEVHEGLEDPHLRPVRTPPELAHGGVELPEQVVEVTRAGLPREAAVLGGEWRPARFGCPPALQGGVLAGEGRAPTVGCAALLRVGAVLVHGLGEAGDPLASRGLSDQIGHGEGLEAGPTPPPQVVPDAHPARCRGGEHPMNARGQNPEHRGVRGGDSHGGSRSSVGEAKQKIRCREVMGVRISRVSPSVAIRRAGRGSPRSHHRSR